MNRQKLFIQLIQYAGIVSLLLVSMTNYSQSVLAQLSHSDQNIVSKPKSQFFAKLKFPPNGAPTGRRRGGAGRNPDCPSSLTGLTALVPGEQGKSYLATTVAEHPTFWFYVPELPETARSADFVLHLSENGRYVDNVYRSSLTLSGKPGIISITTPSQPQYALKTNQEYHWYFEIYCGDRQTTSDHVFVDGFVQKQMLPGILDSESQTAESREYLTYSTNNIWHDGLTHLGQLRRANPQDATINQDWVDLLNAVGLQDLAQEPIVEHYNLDK
ncbi:DUF928 domain-containing protein [Nostoc sp. CCY0012]|uniref:DUF928 domain-containing protein n=1 Tax=Nostoc sp. CCY0012 TaxID=1056123 RepID=UPI0039C75795